MATKIENTDPKAMEAEYQALVRSVPTQSAIFLPTDRMDVAARVEGMKKVKRIYQTELDGRYREALRALRSKYKDRQRCFVIGNGPSLNETDLACLKDEVTFAVNGFFLKARELKWQPTFYVVEDHLVAEDRREWINALEGPTKLFPAYLGYCLAEGPDTIFFNHRPRKSYPHGFDFSLDAADITYAGCTVTFTALQLAAYMGFKEIYLLGVDANYDVPADAAQSKSYGVGVLDMKSDDPNHFHPDYFGKGFRWHDPQVDKMVEAYREARKVIDQTDQRIYNAGIGGKLEVFERRSFTSLFPHARSAGELQAERDAAAASRLPALDATVEDAPRVLLLDITRCHDGTATGELKGTLFANWPAERLMQVSFASRTSLHLTHDGAPVEFTEGSSNWKELKEAIAAYDPQVILYRPVPNSGHMHQFAMEVIELFSVPMITWIMDDWPAALEVKDAKQFAMLEADWRALLARSAQRLSICEAMTVAMQERYGVEFKAFANAIDPGDWPRPRTRPPGTFRLRYGGSLAENMTLQSVKRIAEAVDALAQEGLDIALELRTTPYWETRARPHFASLASTVMVSRTNSDIEEYRTWLSDADVLLIAYNFDEESFRYTRYSMANKLPECLASGAVVFGHGPKGHATIDLLAETGSAVVVTEPSVEELKTQLRQLASDPFRRLDLAEKAQAYAFEHKRIDNERQRFAHVLKEAAATGALSYPRQSHAHVDETQVVSVMLSDQTGLSNVLVDVGAHVGSSAAYFDKLGWRIFCFEPDATNRAQLEKRLGNHSNVTIDTRAVSDKPEQGRSYFASDESTGISGMLNFRDTHKEVAKVDVTTVGEAAQKYGFDRIDFLKIDVEGYDFSVLKGVPWKTLRPRVIECEFEDAKTKLLGHTVQDIADYLVNEGYAVYVSEWHPIIRYGQRHDWQRVFRYPSTQPAADGWGNLLAFAVDPGIDAVCEAFRKCLKTNPEAAQKREAFFSTPEPRPASDNGKPAAPPASFSSPTTSAASAADTSRTPAGTSAADPTVQTQKARTAMPNTTSLYTQIALWAESNSPTMLRLGRLVMRGVKLAQRNFVLSAAAGAVALAVLIGVFAVPGLLLPALILAGLAAAGAGLLFLWRRQGYIHAEINSLRVSVNSANSRLKASDAKLKQVEVKLKQADALSAAAKLATEKLGLLESQDGVILAEIERIKTEVGRQAAEQLLALQSIEAYRDDHEKLAAEVMPVLMPVEVKPKAEPGGISFADAAAIKVNFDKMVAALKLTPALNMAHYQTFNRQVNDDILKKLLAWVAKLGLDYNARALAYLANRICLLESRLHGRLATNIEDIMLRSLVAKAAGGRPREILEIGTLFGVGAAALYETVLFDNRGIHLTLLDPLDGYYGKDNSDLITSQPINETVLRRNFALAGVDMNDVTLIKRFSYESEAQQETGRKRYDLLIIDGDHSYEGVKLDYEVYLPFVKAGGFVIIDDYTSPSWPDVTRYVDETVKVDPRLEFVGAEWRTAVFRVRDAGSVQQAAVRDAASEPAHA